MLHAYIFFHCNLAFSSIEEDQREIVIDRCYTPMLDLAERYDIPVGVETGGWTLEEIARLRPAWLERLKFLLYNGQCEFIGSGYTQIIGPLVPAVVNAANQRLGMAVYEKLLGVRPTLALINEQAYSSGILEHYADNGYKGIIMEWDNPRLAHPEWPQEYRYAPQVVRDMRGRPLKLLWNQSILFQHLQRVVHGEMEIEEYDNALSPHQGGEARILCLYGNDAEIFAFRPGRFETEAPIAEEEWKKVAHALDTLRKKRLCTFCLPSAVFDVPLPHSGHTLALESPGVPVPVKKQPKYNLLRWAVTGRDDFGINARCRRVAEKLILDGAHDELWQELCFLWASDFRTHITTRRWEAYLVRLNAIERKLGLPHSPLAPDESLVCMHDESISAHEPELAGRWLTLRANTAMLRLNTHKGLAIDSLTFTDICPKPLIGTITHGFFEEISLAADFFSGHTIAEVPGQRRCTDLIPVLPQVTENQNAIQVECTVQNFFCPAHKRVTLFRDRPEIEISYIFRWNEWPPGSIRLFHLTLLPGAFDLRTLYYATHNGGSSLERFPMQGEVDHGRAVSFMISAVHAVGMTEGCMEIGDAEKVLQISVHPSCTPLVAMLSHREHSGLPFTRVSFSCREFDDTTKAFFPGSRDMELSIRVRGMCPG